MLNRIHKLIVAAMHNNTVSLFTDCPHREKLGWLEETHLVASGLMFNNDLRGVFAATARNIADTQKADGMVPTTAPQYTVFGPKWAIYDDSRSGDRPRCLLRGLRIGFMATRESLRERIRRCSVMLRFSKARLRTGLLLMGWETGTTLVLALRDLAN